MMLFKALSGIRIRERTESRSKLAINIYRQKLRKKSWRNKRRRKRIKIKIKKNLKQNRPVNSLASNQMNTRNLTYQSQDLVIKPEKYQKQTNSSLI